MGWRLTKAPSAIPAGLSRLRNYMNSTRLTNGGHWSDFDAEIPFYNG